MNGLEKWRFEHTGNKNTDSKGNKFVWCKKHGRKGKNGVQSGIYMPDPHVQEDWKERKTPGNSAWKYNKKTRADEKCKATYVEPEPKDKGKNLSL